MPLWRLQTAISGDTTFPRDAMVITPHFNDVGITTDPQSLCDDLAAAIGAWMEPVDGRQIIVRAYDAQGTPPVLPQGEAIRNLGLAPATFVPRELALCLSYYSGNKTPRNRGRLYIPPVWLTALDTPRARPIEAWRVKVGALATVFADLGGPDVDWCVFSRRDGAAKSVTGWWVDDEWDVIRSRGLRSTARTEGALSE
jgi:hypothetical protein